MSKIPGQGPSAVCTAPLHQGKGLGSSLMRALIGGIAAGGDSAFLHAAATNTNAVRLYAALGFTIRLELPLTVLRPPAL
ncbi:GNAT family N-acetyltransferase [Streptomyces mexicanus]|uniref:GNAT family N-acetyltransferase n=1 Tax=Streptomyces mexicanus TaxID=178566 RepID=UPI00366A018C